MQKHRGSVPSPQNQVDLANYLICNAAEGYLLKDRNLLSEILWPY